MLVTKEQVIKLWELKFAKQIPIEKQTAVLNSFPFEKMTEPQANQVINKLYGNILNNTPNLTYEQLVMYSGNYDWIANFFDMELTPSKLAQWSAANLDWAHIAIQTGNIDILKLVLEKCPATKWARRSNAKYTIAHTATDEKKLDCLIESLKPEANGRSLLKELTSYEETVAHIAARRGPLSTLIYLISIHPPFLTEKSKSGKTIEYLARIQKRTNIRPQLKKTWQNQITEGENVEIAQQGLALLQANPSVVETTQNAVKDNKRKVPDAVSITTSNTSRAEAPNSTNSTTTASTSNRRLLIDLEPDDLQQQPNNKKIKVEPQPVIDTSALRAAIRNVCASFLKPNFEIDSLAVLPKSLSEAEQIAELRAELAKSQQEIKKLLEQQKIMAQTIGTLTQANHELVNLQPEISIAKKPDPTNAALIARYARSGAVGSPDNATFTSSATFHTK